MRAETGLKTVFHHHCAGYVETQDEIARLLELTDPQILGLVFDTGHYTYGSGGADAVAALDRFRERIWYVHLKDCHPGVAAQARTRGWDYFQALRHGVFCELGKGSVDFPGVLRRLAECELPGLHARRTGCPARHGLAEGKRAPQPPIPRLHRTLLFPAPLKELRMTTNHLNVGIIGAGRIGKVHAENLAFRVPEARALAITDLNREAARAGRCPLRHPHGCRLGGRRSWRTLRSRRC